MRSVALAMADAKTLDHGERLSTGIEVTLAKCLMTQEGEAVFCRIVYAVTMKCC